jgi:hypothetical protein
MVRKHPKMTASTVEHDDIKMRRSHWTRIHNGNGGACLRSRGIFRSRKLVTKADETADKAGTSATLYNHFKDLMVQAHDTPEDELDRDSDMVIKTSASRTSDKSVTGTRNDSKVRKT